MTPFNPILAATISLVLAGNASAAGPGVPERALALIDANPGLVRASSADRFEVRDIVVDADGTEHVRFDRRYGGLPVVGGDFVVHSRGGAFRAASLTWLPRTPTCVARMDSGQRSSALPGVVPGPTLRPIGCPLVKRTGDGQT